MQLLLLKSVDSESDVTSNRTQPGENSSPVVKSQTVSGVNNENVFITLKGHDADGDKLRFSIVSYPSHGRLVDFDSLTGKLIYKPDNKFNGVDSFSYKVTDQKRLSSNIGIVSVQLVTSVNKADTPQQDKAATATYQTIDRQVSSEPSAIKDKPRMNDEPAQVKAQSSTINPNTIIINNNPSVNAGLDRSVYEGTKYVTLKGTAKDPDHDVLRYSWEQTGGVSVVLNDANTAKPTFNAPDVDGDKVLAFKLTVSDGKGGEGIDNVKIRIRDRLPAISNQIINNHFYRDENPGSADFNATISRGQ